MADGVMWSERQSQRYETRRRCEFACCKNEAMKQQQYCYWHNPAQEARRIAGIEKLRHPRKAVQDRKRKKREDALIAWWELTAC